CEGTADYSIDAISRRKKGIENLAGYFNDGQPNFRLLKAVPHV
ncbi:hypothetical protein LCGC14_2647290, partial [marine sediment metagenome]